MSFDVFSLFEFVAVLSQAEVARQLGVHRSGVCRVISGELRVSTHLHDLAQAEWGASYNLRGTAEESKRRHEFWVRTLALSVEGPK